MTGEQVGAAWVGADPGGANAFGLAILFASAEVPRRSAERDASRWIRRRYGIASGTVQTANSLRGAALVQGAMFLMRLREKFPEVLLAEARAEAVAKALSGSGSTAVAKLGSVVAAGEHERDALMAGYRGSRRI